MHPTVFSRPVILVGGGVFAAPSLALARHAAGDRAPVIAADGAADKLAALGERPVRIIGDLDSLKDPAAWRAAGVAVDAVTEQDTTDFEKCLYSTEAPLYVAIGFTGARVDHTLAVLSTLMRRADKRVVLIAEREVIFHLPPGRRLRIDVEAGAVVSIFPFTPVRCQPSEGLFWPLEGLTLAPGQQIGTSNRAVGGPVEVAFDDPGAIVCMPHACLDGVIAAIKS